MFDQAEMLEILKSLGYDICREKRESLSRRSKMFSSRARPYIMIEGEKVDFEAVFKMEIKKRIFNI